MSCCSPKTPIAITADELAERDRRLVAIQAATDDLLRALSVLRESKLGMELSKAKFEAVLAGGAVTPLPTAQQALSEDSDTVASRIQVLQSSDAAVTGTAVGMGGMTPIRHPAMALASSAVAARWNRAEMPVAPSNAAMPLAPSHHAAQPRLAKAPSRKLDAAVE